MLSRCRDQPGRWQRAPIQCCNFFVIYTGQCTFILRTRLTILLLVLHLLSSGQVMEFSWAQRNGSGFGIRNAVAPNGTQFTAAGFETAADFDAGPGNTTLTPIGVVDVAIKKLDSAGNTKWVRQIGGPLAHVYVRDIIVRGDAVYITGSFDSTVDFDPGPAALWFYAPDSADGFVCRLDTFGNLVWARQLQSTGQVDSYKLDTDPAGNLLVSGTFLTSMDADPGPGTTMLHTFANDWGSFFIKLSAGGSFIWGKQVSGTKMVSGTAVLDNAGNIFVCGTFFGTADFDPGPGVNWVTALGVGSVYPHTAFFLKLDPAGNFLWFRMCNPVPALSHATDPAGNLLVAGYFQSTCDLDPGPGVANVTAIGHSDMFLLKLDPNGAFVFARHIRGSANGMIYPRSIVVDGAGNCYIVGGFVGSYDFNPSAADSTLASPGEWNVFVSKYSSAGDLLYVGAVGGPGFDMAESVGIDLQGSIYTVGNFTDAVDFDPSAAGVFPLLAVLGGSSGTDDFIQKLRPCAGLLVATYNLSSCSSISFRGVTYASSGSYTLTLPNPVGCDSVITVNITILPRPVVIQQRTICQGQSYEGHTTTGTYRDTLQAANGCDSIRVLQLTVAATLTAQVSRTICEGQSFEGHSVAGTYIDTFRTAGGCDSLRTLQLTVLAAPQPRLGADTALCLKDSFQLSPGSFSSYQWQDGSTLPQIRVTAAGLYSVQVTNGCGSAAAQVWIREGGCSLYFPTAFTPNGDNKNDVFRALGSRSLNAFYLAIYNRWGERVFETRDPFFQWDGKLQGAPVPTGTYVWLGYFRKDHASALVNIRGVVTVIR